MSRPNFAPTGGASTLPQVAPQQGGALQFQSKTDRHHPAPRSTAGALQDSLIFPAIPVPHFAPYYVGRRHNPRATPPHVSVGPVRTELTHDN
jgi:hypothetical protein